MIRIPGLEALTTSYSITSCSVDDMGTLDDAYSTATGLSTTLATMSPYHIQMDITNQYMDSLTIEQLEEFKKILIEKENRIIQEINQFQQDLPKVYIKNKP